MSGDPGRADFERWCRAHFDAETSTLASRVADLLGPVALPALDTLVRNAYEAGVEIEEVNL